ncbi:MAG TPA: hypothetical protein VHW26_03985 [Solirubrobacteraceae bacterium]|nr:hypothetical protein [Solirubrobacteraceae bacterium]
MSRRLRITLIGAGVVLFVVISGLLARFLSVENLERQDVLGLLQAEARGDATEMFAKLHGCTGSCRAIVGADAARLRGAGVVKILAYHSATAFALTGKTGQTRVAWKLGTRLPDVQCVTLHRGGNPVSGISVTLLRISRPIPLTSDC